MASLAMDANFKNCTHVHKSLSSKTIIQDRWNRNTVVCIKTDSLASLSTQCLKRAWSMISTLHLLRKPIRTDLLLCDSWEAQIYKDANVQMQKTVERYVGWSCVLNCFMLSSLSCSLLLLICYPYILIACFQSCLIWYSQTLQGRKHARFETVCVKL